MQVTPRDVQLLRALARFRLARSRDLVSVAFAGVRRDTALKRLRRLFDAQYLTVRVGDLASDNIYSLGPQARAWIAAHGGEAREAPKAPAEHHLAVVGSWVGIARVAHEEGLHLSLLRPEWELREHASAERLDIVPDALVELVVPLSGGATMSVRFALEVDCGTEGLMVLRSKVERYRDLLVREDGLFGWREFGLAVVIVGGGGARRGAVERVLQTSWPGWWLSWDAGEGPPESLRQLCRALEAPLMTSPDPSPDGQGRVRAASARVPGRSVRVGRGLSG